MSDGSVLFDMEIVPSFLKRVEDHLGISLKTEKYQPSNSKCSAYRVYMHVATFMFPTESRIDLSPSETIDLMKATFENLALLLEGIKEGVVSQHGAAKFPDYE